MRNKTKTIIATLFLLTSVTITVSASTGIGIIIGEPTGLSLKFNNFPVLGIAWSMDDYLHIHCDYWVKISRLDRSIYSFWGFGAKLIIHSQKNEKLGMGIRIPLGLRFFISRKVEIFTELVPGMKVIPETKFDIDAGIGIRFYFR